MRTTRLPLDDDIAIGIFPLLAKALASPPRRPEADPCAEARLGEAPLRSPGLLDRLDSWLWRLEQRSLERYLGKAQDVFELEARIRDLERGPISRYY